MVRRFTLPSTYTNPRSADMDAPKKISTSGPRLNRREEWRMSKGLSIRPESKGLNNMGTPKARRKSGRSARRR
jgi:hypothetical protein